MIYASPKWVIYRFREAAGASWVGVVEGAVWQQREEYVGSSSGRGDDGLVVAFAFGAFLVVLGAGSGIACDRRESGQE